MIERIAKGFLALILTAAVVLGGMLAFNRHVVESSSKTVELAMDYRDLRLMSELSDVPFYKILKEIKKRGVRSIGLPEETLRDASVLGEIYYATGSGIHRFKDLNPHLRNLAKRGLIDPRKVYILCEDAGTRKRVQDHLHFALNKNQFKNIGAKVFELNVGDAEIQDLGIGPSEAIRKYLQKMGFAVIPRIRNDVRYKVEGKIKALKGYDTIIFEGEDILGYPDQLALTASSLRRSNIRYGNIEIIKQNGDKKLKSLMKERVIRVHSIPENELKKLSYEKVLTRLGRAIRERSIRLIYVRPFLPAYGPSSVGSLRSGLDPVKYNLQYLSRLNKEIKAAGYKLGRASAPRKIQPQGWQVLVLGIGILIVALLLLDSFIRIPWYLMYLILIFSVFAMVYQGVGSHGFLLEKALALLAAIVFPSYAIISQFSRREESIHPIASAAIMVINVVAETLLGVFLIIGVLANTQFMLTSQRFLGVKIALLAPIFIVAAYFLLVGEGRFSFKKARDRFMDLWYTRVSFYYIIISAALLGALFILVARSGNFVIPVAEAEKYVRLLLEKALVVRPRLKEFLIGYPALFLAAYLFIKDRKNFLWVLLSIAVIAPASLINTFCHVHTPLVVSALRSLNGLILGVILGGLLTLGWSLVQKIKRWKS